jgi:hypothetical protein
MSLARNRGGSRRGSAAVFVMILESGRLAPHPLGAVLVALNIQRLTSGSKILMKNCKDTT